MAPIPTMPYEALPDTLPPAYPDGEIKLAITDDKLPPSKESFDAPAPTTTSRAQTLTRVGKILRAVALGVLVHFCFSYIAESIDNGQIHTLIRGVRQPCPHSQAVQGYKAHLHHVSSALSTDQLDIGLDDHPHHPEHPKHPHPDPKNRWKQWYAKLESEFLSIPTAESAREALQRYTNVTHVAGSEGDYNSALQILKEWADLVGAPLPNNLTDVVFDAGSSESQAYLTGANGKEGARAWTDTYSVWLNYPINSSLSMAKPDQLDKPYWKASLSEDVLEKDPTSGRGMPLFHGYSASGSVSGQVVFAGMGRKQDFADLAAKGIDVKGKIVLVDYGGNFRGLKVRAAQEAGAVGVIIYTDTIEDGDITEANGHAAYPDGPARNPSAVQRGSVQGLSFYPGDPSTPGKPSYRNATRLDPEEADSLPKIPSLPLSYSEAKVLLDAMKGKGVKASEVNDHLAGAIAGVEYWTGPSEDIVHLENFVDLKVRDIWNTYAVLPGHVHDEVVILGNHRDAWTFGAADPNSGTAAFHEIIKGLGHLYQKGVWKPMRTIVFASWDAEEYGLVGSTEFGEDYADWIRQNVVAYFNVDVSVSGSKIQASTSPSLARFVEKAASKVDDPNNVDGADGAAAKKVEVDAFNPLGSGSDYTVFLQHLGIASTDLGYKRGPEDPIYMYHSNYDSFYWMDQFGDPGFKRHLASSQIVGLMALEASTKLFPPINLVDYAEQLNKYFGKVQKLALKSEHSGGAVRLNKQDHKALKELKKAIHKVEKQAKHVEKQKRVLRRKLVKAMAKRHGHGHGPDHKHPPHHPGHPHPPPPPPHHPHPHPPSDPHPPTPPPHHPPHEPHPPPPPHSPTEPNHPHPPPPPHHDHRDDGEQGPPHHPHPHHPHSHPHPHHHPHRGDHGNHKEFTKIISEIRTLNRKLQSFEKGFIDHKGLKQREWYKHLVTAPGRWLGYGATTFPGITEAITLDNGDGFQGEVQRLTMHLNGLVKLLKK